MSKSEHGSGLTPEELHAQRMARLAELESLQESGEYYVRLRRFDDGNMYWRAGFPVPEGAIESWERSQALIPWWVIVDTGTDRPVLGGSKESIEEIWDVYQRYGELLLYDPADDPDDPRNSRPNPHPTSYRHQRSA